MALYLTENWHNIISSTFEGSVTVVSFTMTQHCMRVELRNKMNSSSPPTLFDWIILSRKITLKSISRHFSPWKLRNFIINDENKLIIITLPSQKVITCSINQISAKHHFYSSIDQPYNLSLKYVEAKSSYESSKQGDFEMILRFDSMEKMASFESLVLEASRKWQQRTGVVTNETLQALNIFFNDRLVLQKLSCSHSNNKLEYSSCEVVTDDIVREKKVVFDDHQVWCTWNHLTKALGTDEIKIDSSLDVAKDSDTSRLMLEIDPQLNFLRNPHSRVYMNMCASSPGLKFPIPRMAIVMMVVGTRGDVQPFCLLGKKLQEHGHRVRLATHACFRDFITSSGLEFYPLGGDPHKLSEFMVRTHGNIIPSLSDLIHEVPQNLIMVTEIIESCWGACVKADPHDPEAKPFIADAIISNPVTYGHIHCAEALGIPLHLMFPQPWLPTKAFPHPLSSLSYEKNWNSENYMSYSMVDQMLWLSMRSAINSFRTNTLGLNPIGAADGGWNMLNSHKVPFVKMWSPALVPKPKDWPDYVDISGTFSDEPINTIASNNSPSAEDNTLEKNFIANGYSPDPDLVKFLSSGSPPIFIGFGSMVIEDAESMIRDFLDAAAITGVRIIIQTGWSGLTEETFARIASDTERKTRIIRDMAEAPNTEIFPSPRPDKMAKGSIVEGLGSLTSSIGEVPSNNKAVTEASNLKNSIQDFSECSDDEDYVRISAYDDVYQQSLEDYDTFQSSSTSSLTMNIGRQVAGWFYGKAPPNDSIQRKATSIESSDLKEAANQNATVNLPQTELNCNLNDWKVSTHVKIINQCPHSWLFKQVAAVVHHGGAGTTSAGLQAGKPTWICPFFGDQNFWGEMVYRRQLGPRPCNIQDLTLSKIVDSFNVLLSNEIQENVAKLAGVLKSEDGVTNSANYFYRRLPLDSMLCDVSLFLGETRLAQIYCKDCGLKLCYEISACIHNGPTRDHRVSPCRYVDWKQYQPQNPSDGLVQGMTGLVHEVANGVGEAIYTPVRGMYVDGSPGGAVEVVQGLVKGFIARPLSGGTGLVSKVGAGIRTTLSKKPDQNFPSLTHSPPTKSHSENSAVSVLIERSQQDRMQYFQTDIGDKKLENVFKENGCISTVPVHASNEQIQELFEQTIALSQSSVNSTGSNFNLNSSASTIIENNNEAEAQTIHKNSMTDHVVSENPLSFLNESQVFSEVSIGSRLAPRSDPFSLLNDALLPLAPSPDMKTEKVNASLLTMSTMYSFMNSNVNDRRADSNIENDDESNTIHLFSSAFAVSNYHQEDGSDSKSAGSGEKKNKDSYKQPQDGMILPTQTSTQGIDTPKITSSDMAQKVWKKRQEDIMAAYESALHLKALILEVTHTSSRYLTLKEFTALVEVALTHNGLKTSSTEESSDANSNAFDEVVPIEEIARTIANQLSRGKDYIDFGDIALFVLSYGKSDDSDVWRNSVPESSKVNIHV